MADLDLGRVVGSKIHKVSGKPDNSFGFPGDWSLDTETGDVYNYDEENLVWQFVGTVSWTPAKQG